MYLEYYKAHTLVPHYSMCTYFLYVLQVLTAYIASLSKYNMVVQHPVAELTVRALVTRGAFGRLRSLGTSYFALKSNNLSQHAEINTHVNRASHGYGTKYFKLYR